MTIRNLTRGAVILSGLLLLGGCANNAELERQVAQAMTAAQQAQSTAQTAQSQAAAANQTAQQAAQRQGHHESMSLHYCSPSSSVAASASASSSSAPSGTAPSSGAAGEAWRLPGAPTGSIISSGATTSREMRMALRSAGM